MAWNVLSHAVRRWERDVTLVQLPAVERSLAIVVRSMATYQEEADQLTHSPRIQPIQEQRSERIHLELSCSC